MGNTLQTPPRIHPTLKIPHVEEIPCLNENEFQSQEFTCEICIEPILNPENKFENANKCSHPFCTMCIINYIRVKIEDYNIIGQIKCPALNCDHALDPLAFAQLIGPPLFLRWSDMLCEAAIIDYGKCYCPNRDCSALIVNECGGFQKKSECPSCKRLFCFQCGRVWHAGFACDQDSEELRDEYEVAFARLVEEKKWMRCPRCRIFIERIEGCNYVMCRCGRSFCYGCGMVVSQCCCELGSRDYFIVRVIPIILVSLFVYGWFKFVVVVFTIGANYSDLE